MRTKPLPGGATEVKLDKSETRRVLEASYIIDHVARVKGDETLREMSARMKGVAHVLGAEHIDENGLLKESPRQRAVTNSAPE